MKLELISFKICPFVQRSVITLLYKGVDFEITYIDLEDPPAWFKKISPFGRVPVLRVDDDTVLFESAIINEFIDDVTPGRLKPEDPLLCAKNRSWIHFGEQCLVDQYRLMVAETEADFEQTHAQALGNLHKLEEVFGDGPYFNGARPSLVDFAYAPLWTRYALLNIRRKVFDPAEFPKLAAWSERLLAMEAVRDSVVADFEALFRAYIRKHGGYAAELFG